MSVNQLRYRGVLNLRGLRSVQYYRWILHDVVISGIDGVRCIA